MKLRNVAYTLAFVMAAPAAFAQKVLPFSIDLGPKVGVNFSKIQGGKWDDSYKTNLLGGVFAGIQGKRLGVAAEVLFSQSRYTVGSDFYSIYHEYYEDVSDSLKKGSFRVSYLNVPVLAQVKLLPMVWLQVGPQFSSIVSVKDADALLQDASDIFKSGDVSGVVGLDIKLPFGLRVNGRYVLGFSNVNNTTVADTWKHRSIQIAVGYSFL